MLPQTYMGMDKKKEHNVSDSNQKNILLELRLLFSSLFQTNS